jgi:hypothetical protein
MSGKKHLAWIAALGATVALAYGVTSPDSVGYVSVTVPGNGSFNLMSMPFTEPGTDVRARLIQNLFTNQLQGGFADFAADRVYKWDVTNQQYVIYFKTLNDTWERSDVPGDTSGTLAPGEAFWVQSVVGSADRTLYLLGQVPKDSQVSMPLTAAGSAFEAIASFYPVEVCISNIVPADAIGSDLDFVADRIFAWDYEIQNYDIYYLNGDMDWAELGGSEPTADCLPPGRGFFYQRGPGSTIPAEWSMDKPYTFP